MKQVFNPYMPSYEYVPDGEPHVFGDRIYVYGSHDRFGATDFCLNDYVCYSASVHDLSDWKYEGIIYRKEQDPRNQNIPADAKRFDAPWAIPTEDDSLLNPPGIHAMWAPDVVKGPDGRFYLYYCLDFLKEVAVAVCDTPAGKYEFYGFVKHADGTILGIGEGDYEQFDPGIFIDDDGSIYLYSGHAAMTKDTPHQSYWASHVMTLCEDMLTIKKEPKELLPHIHNAAGTGYEGHEFFEASSIRKIHGKYYFVYSSVRSHELCYAVSDKPDEGYVFGGTIVDIGDVFLNGRTDEEALNCLGNTHGGIECCDGQWYVFYHRQTNCTQFSRQGCAEKIYFDEQGKIAQVEVTSCGLNKGPLNGLGKYPARIACELTRNGKNVTSLPQYMRGEYPYFTQDMRDSEPCEELEKQEEQFPIQYICNVQDGCRIGFKYFEIQETKGIAVTVRGKAEGKLQVLCREMSKLGCNSQCKENDGKEKNYISYEECDVKTETDALCGQIEVTIDSHNWTEKSTEIVLPTGIQALYLEYQGEGALDMALVELKG